MFKFMLDRIEWKENLKDKMITFIDLYRKELGEPIKDIKYKRENHDSYRMIMIYEFNDVDITFESVDSGSTKWIAARIEVDNDDKNYFDKQYEIITTLIDQVE